MSNKPVIIIGNGGHAAVLTEVLLLLKRKILGFTTPEEQVNFYQIMYLGNDDRIISYNPDEVELVLGLGSTSVNSIREKIFSHFKNRDFTFANVVHPSVIISPTALLGEGVQIMAGSIIQSQAHISDNSIINTGTVIEHNSLIGPHVHIAPGCKLSGNVKIEKGCHIGTGSTIIQGISVGQYTLVGAGAVVVQNVGSKKKVIGVPAKEV